MEDNILYPVDEITGFEPNRDMGDLSELKRSIKEIGLINPVTIDISGKLLAGRRRLAVVKELGWTEVPVRILNPKDGLDCLMISFHENSVRKPLTDPENRRMIAEIDAMMREKFGSSPAGRRWDDDDEVIYSGGINNEWTQTKTGEQLGVSQKVVSEAVQAEEFVKEHDELKNLSTTVILEMKKAPQPAVLIEDVRREILAKKVPTSKVIQKMVKRQRIDFSDIDFDEIDYFKIKISDEKMTRGAAMNAAYKLKRLLFALTLCPDWQIASTFADIERHADFLIYWLDEPTVCMLQDDVKRRVEDEYDESGIFTVIEHAFNKHCSGYDYLNPFLTDDEYIEEELEIIEPLMSQEEMMSLIGLEIDWSHETIINRVDALIELERVRRNSPMIESGKYWIVAYRQIPLKTILKPFVLLAKVSEENNQVLTIQGLWPIEFMKKRLEREVPMPYTSTIDDMRYIRVEAIPTERGPHMFKYKNIESYVEKDE